MEPLFFGNDVMQLYGVFHPAAGTSSAGGANKGILLCPPVGQEYMRMHRSYRWLAELLTRQGHHVLRYDYPGLGNSSGCFAEQTIERWVASARIALDELDALAGQGSRVIIGARLGAVVAAQVAAERPTDKLVLWEPREPTSVFFDEMQKFIDAGAEPRSNYLDDRGVLHFNGYAFSPAFIDSVRRHCLNDLDYSLVNEILVISSTPEGAMDHVLSGNRESKPTVSRRHVEGLSDWNTVDQIGGIFLPQAVLRTIEEWV